MDEVWRDIKGYEGYYQVSNKGRVRSLTRTVNWFRGRRIVEGQIIAKINCNGYDRVSLCKNSTKKYHKVSRLVAIHFIPNPNNKPEVNHINGVKDDDRVENLEWATRSENQQHAVDEGLTKQLKGEKAPGAKLTKEEAYKIKELLKGGNKTYKQIANRFNVSTATVNDIKSGRSWTHL